MGAPYILHIVRGKNPDPKELLETGNTVVFSYETDHRTSRALGITRVGQFSVKLNKIFPCKALTGTFVIKAEDPNAGWKMSGTYHSSVGIGRLVFRKDKPKIEKVG